MSIFDTEDHMDYSLGFINGTSYNIMFMDTSGDWNGIDPMTTQATVLVLPDYDIYKKMLIYRRYAEMHGFVIRIKYCGYVNDRDINYFYIFIKSKDGQLEGCMLGRSTAPLLAYESSYIESDYKTYQDALIDYKQWINSILDSPQDRPSGSPQTCTSDTGTY